MSSEGWTDAPRSEHAAAATQPVQNPEVQPPDANEVNAHVMPVNSGTIVAPAEPSALDNWLIAAGTALGEFENSDMDRAVRAAAGDAHRAVDDTVSEAVQHLDRLAASAHDLEEGLDLALRVVGVRAQRAKPPIAPGTPVDPEAVQREIAAVARALRDELMHVAAEAGHRTAHDTNIPALSGAAADAMRDKLVAISGGLLLVGAAIVGVFG